MLSAHPACFAAPRSARSLRSARAHDSARTSAFSVCSAWMRWRSTLLSSLRRSTCLVASSAAALAAPASSFRSAARDLRCSLAVGVRTCAPAAAALVMSPSAIAAPSGSHATVPSLPLTRRARPVCPLPHPHPAAPSTPHPHARALRSVSRWVSNGARRRERCRFFAFDPAATGHPEEVPKRHRASTCQPCDVAMITRVVLVYQYHQSDGAVRSKDLLPRLPVACLGSHWRVHVMGVVRRRARRDASNASACLRARAPRCGCVASRVCGARPRGTCACWCTGR